jgi:hypothetical protein
LLIVSHYDSTVSLGYVSGAIEIWLLVRVIDTMGL